MTRPVETTVTAEPKGAAGTCVMMISEIYTPQAAGWISQKLIKYIKLTVGVLTQSRH